MPSNLNVQPKRIALILSILVCAVWLALTAWAVLYFGVDLNQTAGVKLLSIVVQLILFAVAIVFGPFLWVQAVVNLFRMTAERRKDLPKESFRPIRWNPFNIVAHPKLLTQQGLEHRRKLFKSIGLFSTLILAVFAWEYML